MTERATEAESIVRALADALDPAAVADMHHCRMCDTRSPYGPRHAPTCPIRLAREAVIRWDQKDTVIISVRRDVVSFDVEPRVSDVVRLTLPTLGLDGSYRVIDASEWGWQLERVTS